MDNSTGISFRSKVDPAFAKVGLCGVIEIVCMMLCSCSTVSYREVYPTLMDGKYDSEFPYRGCSTQLEQISESVKMISTIAYYKSYIFPIEEKVRLSELHEIFIKNRAIKEVYQNNTASGSATVISFSNNRIAMITCAHVVNYDDTVVTYYIGEDKKPTEFIKSYSIKNRQTNYVAAIQGAQDLEILAIDKENDLAIMGQKIDPLIAPLTITAFNYPIGKAKELEWGAFVYLFGYPSGFKIVTKAIVSNPNRDKNGSFITDAVINRGFSGGIILAVRDGVPNFELVGMVKIMPGYQQTYLTPSKRDENMDFDPNIPFKGDIYTDRRIEVAYGIAPAIPAELIVEFLTSNKQRLLDKGYDISSFLDRKPPVIQENK